MLLAEQGKPRRQLGGQLVISGFSDLNVKWQSDMTVHRELGHRRSFESNVFKTI